MKSYKKYIPEGMRDILIKDCCNKVKIEELLRKTYLSMGFLEVISPTIEYFDVFNGDIKPIPQENMYKLLDSQGRILVLRPDMTMPIARIVSTKLKDYDFPLRLCYTANIFRVNRDFDGKMREFTQSGIEIIGAAGVKADAEALISGINALLACKINDFTIELGHANFFKGIIEEINLDDEEFENIRELIESKNFTLLNQFINERRESIPEDIANILSRLPELFGGIDVIRKLKFENMPNKAREAAESLKNIYGVLKAAGLEKYISFDLGMVQDIDYYTGIVFKGYCKDSGYAVLSGGRYDNLILSGDKSVPATGLAINVDRIVNILLERGEGFKTPRPHYLIHYDEDKVMTAYKSAEILRKNGLMVEISLYGSIEEAVSYGVKRGIQRTLVISSGLVEVYDKSGEILNAVDEKEFMEEIDI